MLNDTLAIVGTPVMLQIALKTGTRPKILLLTLAFAVTIGSVMSPIGNPQNLLVAVAGHVSTPFVTFLRYLAIPTIINLLLTYFVVRIFFRNDLLRDAIGYDAESITDKKLALLSKISLFVVLGMILVKIMVVSIAPSIDFRLTYVAVAGALPIVIGSPRRMQIVRNIDWFTLVFFAAMFVLMESVWQSGFFQSIIDNLNGSLLSTSMILLVSIVLSQFISNVPLVALYLPLLAGLGATTKDLVVLAAGSTIAGNLSILGAASNVIIIQNAEKRSGETLTLWEFVRIGIPLTALNGLVYWVFFQLF
jgi:Na+/H+ antiporter NhaD/arsenite permease-like protein